MLQTLAQREAPVLGKCRDYSAIAAAKKYSTEKIVTLDVKSILRPKELDVCPEREEDQIEEFKAKWAELDRVEVFWVESLNGWVASDGWARLDAANELNIVTAEFTNKGKGTLEDALKLRMLANCKHGKRWKREQWVKLAQSTHELLIAKRPKQTLTDTAKFLGINVNTFLAYFRYPNGFHCEPVDHPYGGRKGDHGRKREALTSHNRIVTDACHAMSRAASLLDKTRVEYLEQELKDRLARQLAKLKHYWEKL